MLRRLFVLFAALVVLAACAGQSDAPPTANPQDPAAANDDYRLGPEDKIKVTVFGEPDLSGEFVVDSSGVLAAPLWTVSPSMSANAVMPAFVVIAIGGLGSLSGAVVAGLAVGVVTALTIQFWPEASAGAMYALMFAIMLLRPRGLFGEKWERFE